MRVREILEDIEWDHGLQFLNPHSKDIDWHNELLNKKREHIYIVVDKNGKAVRTNLSHKAALYIKDRADLIKKYGKLSIKRVQ